MARFAVFAGEVLVGHSELEYGDPPMGVAFGVFIPMEAYAQIQHECTSNHRDQSRLALSVQAEDGTVIPCVGVAILDYSAEVEPPYREVNVLGVPHPPYGELFPQHVAAYDRKFGQGVSGAGT